MRATQHRVRRFLPSTAMPPTARLPARNGAVMNTDKQDVAARIELLKMSAKRRPRCDAGQDSQSERFREDRSLLEMWPEACRRIGVGRREFPLGVIKLWKQSLGTVKLKGLRGINHQHGSALVYQTP